jgi:hypothetical protein
MSGKKRIFSSSPFHNGKSLLPEHKIQQRLRKKYQARFKRLASDLSKEGLDRNDLRTWAQDEIKMALLFKELRSR